MNYGRSRVVRNTCARFLAPLSLKVAEHQSNGVSGVQGWGFSQECHPPFWSWSRQH